MQLLVEVKQSLGERHSPPRAVWEHKIKDLQKGKVATLLRLFISREEVRSCSLVFRVSLKTLWSFNVFRASCRSRKPLLYSTVQRICTTWMMVSGLLWCYVITFIFGWWASAHKSQSCGEKITGLKGQVNVLRAVKPSISCLSDLKGKLCFMKVWLLFFLWFWPSSNNCTVCVIRLSWWDFRQKATSQQHCSDRWSDLLVNKLQS